MLPILPNKSSEMAQFVSSVINKNMLPNILMAFKIILATQYLLLLFRYSQYRMPEKDRDATLNHNICLSLKIMVHSTYLSLKRIGCFCISQANTTVSGGDCADWSNFAETPPNELLILGSGLHKNLCRNPDWDSQGPWCYNRNGVKEYCNVPKCGGALSKFTSVVASFEDFGPDYQEPDNRFSHNTWGSMVTVDTTTSYCGRASAYFPRSTAEVNPDWLIDRESGKNPECGWFNPAEIPYICMAYKIPATSHVVLGIDFDEFGWQYFGLNTLQLPWMQTMTARFDVIAGMFAHSLYALNVCSPCNV
jgi:hypothetical protein